MQLLFVYNAAAGLFSALADAAHKILSPRTYQYDICRIAHGRRQERAYWLAFVDRLAADCEFLHWDQFRARYPALKVRLPASLRLGEGSPEVCIDQAARAGCGDEPSLIALIRDRCAAIAGPVA
jgi:hypothetical protein